MTQPKLNISLGGATQATIGGRNDLLIGTLPSTSAYAGTVVEKVNLKTVAELDAIFGANSEIRNRIDKYLTANKRKSRLDVQVLEEDEYAEASAGAIAFSGTSASADGTLEVAMVDENDFSAVIDVLSGETPEQIAVKVKNAFATSVFPKLPVVVDNSSGTVSITARDKGTVGNFYGIKVSGSVAGITYALTAMTGGANNPTYTAALFPTARYWGVGIPQIFKASVSVFKTILNARFNEDNAIKDGRGFIGVDDTLGNLTTLIEGENSGMIVHMGNRLVPSPNPNVNTAQTGASILTPADWRVAEFMGIRSIRMELNAPISDFVVANNRDSFGGMALASLPYHNTPMAQTAVTKANMLFNETEKAQLEALGFTVVDTNASENAMLMSAVVTNYKTDSLGIADNTFKYLNYVDTASICREYIFNSMKVDLAQSRLTEGDTVPDRNIHNDASIKALFMEYYSDLADETLVQAGGAIASAVSDDLGVVLDLANRTVSMTAETFPIVTQIGTVNIAITVKFSTL